MGFDPLPAYYMQNLEPISSFTDSHMAGWTRKSEAYRYCDKAALLHHLLYTFLDLEVERGWGMAHILYYWDYFKSSGKLIIRTSYAGDD